MGFALPRSMLILYDASADSMKANDVDSRNGCTSQVSLQTLWSRGEGEDKIFADFLLLSRY